MEQQKNAFHKLGLESELLEDFIRSMAPFKSKSTPQFPLPEFIFKKKFLFLTAPLTILQKTSPKPKEKTPESAKETEQTKKEQVPPKNGLSRFGVQLTENEEADDSVVIPEQIQSILEQYRQSRRADSLPSAQQIGLIESLSLSKKQAKTTDAPVEKWIEDLLSTEEIPKNIKKDSQGISNVISSGPLFFSNEQSTQFYNV
jgi:hypothetical protein